MSLRWVAAPIICCATCLSAVGQEPGPAEFFEKEVRPLLAERCLKCHAGAKPKAHLDLSSREALLRGGSNGPAAVSGKPTESLLIRAVRHQPDTPPMPPKGDLTPSEINVLVRWVAMGLPWPGDRPAIGSPATGSPINEDQRVFWSFQPVHAKPPPAVRDNSWPRSGIDRFILAGLEERGLRPAAPADRRTLIRRATFDLTGLPPTPEKVDAFVRDDSPDAFARVVDRLLASPQYGERWGRHWLDVVRYADSFDARGSGGPGDIAHAWRYRDWVVDSVNRDLPYDQFIIHQIAGDLLPAPDGDSMNVPGIIATGLLAIGNWGGGDADKEKLLTDIADDQVDVVSRSFLGLTVACARCHDHKFDPIPTADYYGLAGIFFSTHILPNVGPKTDGPPMLAIPLAPPAEVERHARYAAKVTDLEKKLQALMKNPLPQALAAGATVQRELELLRAQAPSPLPYANGAHEGGVPGSPHAGVHDVHIHVRGSYARLGKLVPRHFPAVLGGDKQPPVRWGSGRLKLARWIASPSNPLTARVMANRIWQYHFGEGLVRTPSNFGKLGEQPTHPELLDYLAARFIASGWSVKSLHRTIMLSAAYQQSSEPAAATLKTDPDNRLVGRMNRRRLEAEAVRDNLLAVAGRLDPRMGGPALKDFSSPRRTLYLITVRSDRSGFGPLFDAADPTAPVDRRTVSTVAPQALFLMNHPFAVEQARALASRIRAERGGNPARVSRAYALLFGRPPTLDETRIGLEFLAQADEASGWEAYCQLLLCTNEFVYVD